MKPEKWVDIQMSNKNKLFWKLLVIVCPDTKVVKRLKKLFEIINHDSASLTLSLFDCTLVIVWDVKSEQSDSR